MFDPGMSDEELNQRRLAGMCLRKVRHESRAAVNLAVKVMGSRAKGTRPYHCQNCGGWHLGTPRGMEVVVVEVD